MAKQIGMPKEQPQKIKHHLQQLEKKGFLAIDRVKGIMDKSSSTPGWAKGLLNLSEKEKHLEIYINNRLKHFLDSYPYNLQQNEFILSCVNWDSEKRLSTSKLLELDWLSN